ncbi:MAG: hypothetical protein ACRC3H_01095 [Lachnospiraceae bacterium]
MLLNKLKGNKLLITIFALSLSATILLGGVSLYTQHVAEKDVAGTLTEAAVDDTYVEDTSYPELLLKDIYDEEVGRETCEKFNLDYDTVSLMNMSDEMLDYSSAMEIAARSGDQPLLITEEDDEMIYDIEDESLEMLLNEGYAFGQAGKVITAYCESINLNPETGKIKDLTDDQLFEISKLCREASPHGDE